MKVRIVLYNIILVITFCVFILMFNNTIREIEGSSAFLGVKIIKLLLAISGLLIVTRLATNKHLPSYLFLAVVLSISLVLRFWWITAIDTAPISDFSYMVNAARDLLAGDRKRIFNSHYFDIASDNIPFTLYETGVLFFFKTVMALKILNVLLSTCIVYFIYRIAKIISNDKVARVASIIACLFPPFIIYTSVLTNQTLSIVFILWAILVFIKKGNLIYVGLLMALANLIRPTAIIYLIGIFVFLLIANIFFNEKDILKKARVTIVDSVKLIAPYFLLIYFVSFTLYSTGIIKHGLFDNPIPNYKLLVGLNHETTGNYSAEDNKLAYDLDTFEEKSKALIKERTEDKEKLAELFKNKFKVMWSKPDAALFWAMTDNIENQQKYQFLRIFEQYFYLALIGCSAIFLLSLLFNQSVVGNSFYSLFCIILLGFVIIYLFIEIQTRYRYEVYPLIVFLGGAGIFKLSSYIFPESESINKLDD